MLTGSTEHAGVVTVGTKPGPRKHRISGTIYYVNREYSNSSQYELYDPLLDQYINVEELYQGLDYNQSIFSLRGGYIFFTRKINFRANVSLQNEVNRGFFRTTANSELNYNSWDLTPSLATSFWITELLRGGLNYSRRVIRPDIERLNPYSDRSDPMNIVEGNPFLKGELSDDFAISLSYGRQPRTKGAIQLGYLYSSINNAIEQVVDVANDGVSTTTFRNLGKLESQTFSILHMQPRIWNWLNFSQRGDYRKNYFRSGNPNIGSRVSSTINYNASVLVSLFPTTTFGIEYNLSSNIGTTQTIGTNIYHHLSLILSQVLVKNKLYGSLSLGDPFLSSRYHSYTIGDERFRQSVQQQQRGTIVSFSLRWNFGRFRGQAGEGSSVVDDRGRIERAIDLP